LDTNVSKKLAVSIFNVEVGGERKVDIFISATNITSEIHEVGIHFWLTLPYYRFKSRDGSVGIATDYGLDDRGSNPGGGWEFSLRHRVQTSSGAHTTSYPLILGLTSPGVKRLGHEANHSPPCSVEAKNAWS
jgi:hypothetical protein